MTQLTQQPRIATATASANIWKAFRGNEKKSTLFYLALKKIYDVRGLSPRKLLARLLEIVSQVFRESSSRYRKIPAARKTILRLERKFNFSVTQLKPFFFRIFSGEFKVYTRRWIVLAIFVFYSASNAMQWIQFSIIANVVQKYVFMW